VRVRRSEGKEAGGDFARKTRGVTWRGRDARREFQRPSSRGGPGRGTKAICRPLYCRIVHTGAQLRRPG